MQDIYWIAIIIAIFVVLFFYITFFYLKPKIARMDGTNFFAGVSPEITYGKFPNQEECEAKCLSEKTCGGYTYVKVPGSPTNELCLGFSQLPPMTKKEEGHFSGYKMNPIVAVKK